MPNASLSLFETLANSAAPESFAVGDGSAFFAAAKGKRTNGDATVSVTRSSIAIHFSSDAPLTVVKAGYGEANGSIGAANSAWFAPKVNDIGLSAAGGRVFGAPELVMTQGTGEAVAATRLVFAGAAWRGSAALGDRRVVAVALSKEAVSHHDARLAIVIEGDLDAATIAAVDRASSFVAGLDLELLRIDSFSAAGDLIKARHLRGFRRLGRGPHSPFSGIADEYRMRAWVALVTAIPRLEQEGIPITTMINHIAAHNHVGEINASAPLLLLATQTAAYHRIHGQEVGTGVASRRPEMTMLSRALDLGLSDEDLDRFEKLRVELLETGFFHKPGYETGRPQRDIKFLRDIAHMTVFRLCGYSGPFYGAETFTVRDTAATAP